MDDIPTDADLLKAIRKFCKDKGVKLTAFGRLSIGDGNLVGDLEAGKRSLTLKTANRIASFMANHGSEAAQDAAA
jgi:hypothetical protein